MIYLFTLILTIILFIIDKEKTSTGILISKGVNYTVIAVFTTTLMLVGIVTYPVEKDLEMINS